MRWRMSWRAEKAANALAKRHYSCQSPESSQFVPPGEPIVLMTPEADALWVSLRQKAEYTDHDWPGAWMCTIFRNESRILSSELIREAVAATRFFWENPPENGFVTFVDPGKVRHKRDPGRCFIRAGFSLVGETKVNRLLVFQMLAENMPEAAEPIGYQRLFAW